MSMTPGYFQGLAVYLLKQAAHPNITSVETYAEAGVTGPGWGQYGLKIVDKAGQATYLTIARGSSTSVEAVPLADLSAEYTSGS